MANADRIKAEDAAAEEAIRGMTRQEQARMRMPLTSRQVREDIAIMEQKTSRKARKGFAALAIKHGNYTQAARQVYVDYLASFGGK